MVETIILPQNDIIPDAGEDTVKEVANPNENIDQPKIPAIRQSTTVQESSCPSNKIIKLHAMMRKRGRPKGTVQTGIGLKRRHLALKGNKPTPFCKLEISEKQKNSSFYVFK